jgi:hypothetical protein
MLQGDHGPVAYRNICWRPLREMIERWLNRGPVKFQRKNCLSPTANLVRPVDKCDNALSPEVCFDPITQP